MSTTRRHTSVTESATSPYVTSTSPLGPAPASALIVEVDLPAAPPRIKSPAQALKDRSEWSDPEFREGYLAASIEEGVAWQIRANRERRELTQAALGERIGTTQTGIARLENPEYGKHSLQTLLDLAHAFDCALSVRFVPFSQLALDSEDLGPEALYVIPYEEETRIHGGHDAEHD